MAAMGNSFIGKGYEVRWLIKQRNRPSLSPSSIKISVSVCFLTAAVGSTSLKQTHNSLVGRPITRKEWTLAKFTSSADDIALRSHGASRLIVPLLKQPCLLLMCAALGGQYQPQGVIRC